MSIKFNDREWAKMQAQLEDQSARLSAEASAAASQGGSLDERTDAYCAVFAREGIDLNRGEIRRQLQAHLSDDIS
ncbi:hypothetical protein [Micrococcus luteus]|uniref:hypothetical protein n=1 Tax=Micrococcus luteus TaxID=1270 RepID=UPI0010AE3C06|nr:hypothetical protein [Micrococcus luteus]MCV7512447.1 hypothetical protein [Micrococcus luteus]MCV7516636.1 hypothetical protein [Micrococcus luteus]MCV7521069.1 hypothetical protein [Micrococcus luteus]MCV7572626.1 hypothetical protein [Micrococcus luteus]MCV7576176.1 hypothetical protein [Micrococcus luteus]